MSDYSSSSKPIRWADVGMAVVVSLAIVAVVLSALWSGVRVSEADRRYRLERVQACKSVDTATARALCITGAK